MSESSWPTKAVALALALEDWEVRQAELGVTLEPLDGDEHNPFEFVAYISSALAGFMKDVGRQLFWTSADNKLQSSYSDLPLSELHCNQMFHSYANSREFQPRLQDEFSTPNLFVAEVDRNDANSWNCDSVRVLNMHQALVLFELKQCVYARDAVGQVSTKMGRYTLSLRSNPLFKDLRIVSIVVVINIPRNYAKKHPVQHRNFTSMCAEHGINILWWNPQSMEDVEAYFEQFDKWALGSHDKHGE